LKENRVMRKVNDTLKFVVPGRVKWRILKTFHDDMGHQGVEKVLRGMSEQLWFPKMRKYSRQYIDSCIDCAYYKLKCGKKEGRLNPIDKIPIPFHTIHLDHVGPFQKSRSGNTYVLGIIDAFSKFIIVKAVRNTTAKPVVKALNDVTGIFGLPCRFITDRGAAFTSNLFEKYCDDNDIQHIKCAVGTPRANGQIERYNRTLLNALKTLSSINDNRWDENLRAIQWGMNAVPNDTTKLSAQKIVFTYDPRHILENKIILALHADGVRRTEEEVNNIQDEAVQQTISSQQSQQDIMTVEEKMQPCMMKEVWCWWNERTSQLERAESWNPCTKDRIWWNLSWKTTVMY
jgi:Integrase zinc binding domain/Integrase core domain